MDIDYIILLRSVWNKIMNKFILDENSVQENFADKDYPGN